MPERMATADIAGVLVRVHHLLTQAESEARAEQEALVRTRATAWSGRRATDYVQGPVEVARSRFLADRFADLAEEVFGADRVHRAERLDDAIVTAIDRVEAATDVGAGVLITGSVTVAGEARLLLGVPDDTPDEDGHEEVEL